MIKYILYNNIIIQRVKMKHIYSGNKLAKCMVINYFDGYYMSLHVL